MRASGRLKGTIVCKRFAKTQINSCITGRWDNKFSMSGISRISFQGPDCIGKEEKSEANFFEGNLESVAWLP